MAVFPASLPHDQAPRSPLRQRISRAVPTLMLTMVAAAGLPTVQGLVGVAAAPIHVRRPAFWRGVGTAMSRKLPSSLHKPSAHLEALRMSGGGGEKEERKIPWGVVYGMGFGAITAARICMEAHLQGFYMRVLGLAPATVGAGWSLMCLLVAFSEPFIGLSIDAVRNSGFRVTSLLRIALVPWMMLLYLVWLPTKDLSPLRLFVPVVVLSLLQAGLNLGFLSIYPSLFPTPEARSKALVPQQGMVVTGLLMGVTLPAILSTDWRVPKAFSMRFTAGVGAILAASIALLCFWEARQVAAGQAKPAASDAKGRAASFGGFSEIVQDRRMARVLASIFVGQLGNALLASSLPLFCRDVVDLSKPIGPFLGGLVPALSSHWQFSLCFTVFYFLGGITAGWWGRLASRVGTVGALRTAMRSYAVGCVALALGPGGMVPALKPIITASAVSKFAVLLACYAINGLALGGLVSLPDVVLAEGVKELEARGGVGKAGKVYGAKQLVYRLGSALQGLVTAFVIAFYGGSWGTALPILAGLLPAVCYAAAAQVLPESRVLAKPA